MSALIRRLTIVAVGVTCAGWLAPSTGAHDGLTPRRLRPSAFTDNQTTRIRRAGGPIVLAGASRGADVYTGGGTIRIGPSSGLIRAVTGAGSIELGPAAGSVIAKTGNGDVHISLSPPDEFGRTIDIESGLGGVVLELPRQFSGDLDLETAYTDGFGRPTEIITPWRLDQEATTTWDRSRGTPRRYVRSRGRIGDGTATLRVRTVNGDITLRRARPVW